MFRSCRIVFFFIVGLTFNLIGCAPRPTVTPLPGAMEKPVEEQMPKVQIAVESENLRSKPNGEIIGEATRGQKFSLLLRRGNWCRIETGDLPEVWVWAPSLGFPHVNPISVNLLVGGKDYQDIDSVEQVLGMADRIHPMGAGIFQLEYLNDSGQFGSTKFLSILLIVDRASHKVLKCEISLPPFEGTSDDLLKQLDLTPVKPTAADFERVRFENKFAGIERLEMLRFKGDFKKFASVSTWKISPDRWRNKLSITARQALIDTESGEFNVLLTMESREKTYNLTAITAQIGVYSETKRIGSWSLGPADLVLAPGETGIARFAPPVDSKSLDPSKVSLTVELESAVATPPAKQTQNLQ